jgi:hypothetical protein
MVPFEGQKDAAPRRGAALDARNPLRAGQARFAWLDLPAFRAWPSACTTTGCLYVARLQESGCLAAR